jgi:hypothetical protein
VRHPIVVDLYIGCCSRHLGFSHIPSILHFSMSDLLLRVKSLQLTLILYPFNLCHALVCCSLVIWKLAPHTSKQLCSLVKIQCRIFRRNFFPIFHNESEIGAFWSLHFGIAAALSFGHSFHFDINPLKMSLILGFV